MAYASNFNPDALPACVVCPVGREKMLLTSYRHAEPDEAAQILARRNNTSGSSSPQPARPALTNTPPKNPSPTNYSIKPPPPLPGNIPAPHRNTVGAGSRPPQPLYSPIASPQLGGPSAPPASLQAGYSQQQQQHLGPQGYTPRRLSAPSRGGNAALWPLFRAVDRRGTGQLSEEELSQALLNGDFTSFDPATVRMMIKMHDHDQSGTIAFDEFCALWNFLGSWRNLFDKFDEDHSGYISYDEFTNALTQFGYNLTPQFVGMLYSTYDRGNPNGLSFDLFVQSCLTLKRLTDVFKKYDTDRDGYITLSFESFLTEVLQSR